MSRTKRLLLLGLVIGLTVVLDQWTKEWAIHELKFRASRIYWGDFFRFTYAENPGAFLSLGAALPEAGRFYVLTVLVGAILLGLFIFVLVSRRIQLWQLWGSVLVLAGGASNLADRVFRPGGHVVDFMNMGIGSLRTGVFNVADVIIMAGIGCFLVDSIKNRSKPEKKESSENAV